MSGHRQFPMNKIDHLFGNILEVCFIIICQNKLHICFSFEASIIRVVYVIQESENNFNKLFCRHVRWKRDIHVYRNNLVKVLYTFCIKWKTVTLLYSKSINLAKQNNQQCRQWFSHFVIYHFMDGEVGQVLFLSAWSIMEKQL